MANASITFQFTDIPGSTELLAIKSESISSFRLSVIWFKAMEQALLRRDLPEPYLKLMAKTHLEAAKTNLPNGGKLHMGFRDDNEVMVYEIYRRSIEEVVAVRGFKVSLVGLEASDSLFAIGRTDTVRAYFENLAGFKFMELEPFENDKTEILGYWM